jgi:hypothetical protein
MNCANQEPKRLEKTASMRDTRMNILGTVVAAGVTISSVANAAMAEFIEDSFACPSEDALVKAFTAFEKANDADTIMAIAEHYDCYYVKNGTHLKLVSRGRAVTIVAKPNVFSKDTWLYCPCRSVKTGP